MSTHHKSYLAERPDAVRSGSAAFPSDPFEADGLTVRNAEKYSSVSRRLTIWGGTISSISGPTHAGSSAGNSTAEFLVKFTAKSSAVVLAWGGHLAQSAFWNLSGGGSRDGAGEVSGAPWHMRTLQLDGAGNRNQDRSIPRPPVRNSHLRRPPRWTSHRSPSRSSDRAGSPPWLPCS